MARSLSPPTPGSLGAARVLEYCETMGMRHTELAISLELDRTYFLRVLRGERSCSLSLAVRLEDMLSIPPKAWLEGVHGVYLSEKE